MKPSFPSFFDLENQFAKIYQLNNFLHKLKHLIPRGIFRSTFELIHHKERLSHASRTPFDAILMFKIIVLQMIYNKCGIIAGHSVFANQIFMHSAIETVSCFLIYDVYNSSLLAAMVLSPERRFL